jgi:hypothetical protein
MDPQSINPIQPTQVPITSPQPAQDVPTVHGDPTEKKERLSTTILVFSIILAFYGFRGLNVMSIDTARCNALDEISTNLCNAFNTAIIAKNVCFGAIMVFCIITAILIYGKKKLARSLGVFSMALTAIAAIVAFLSVLNLINTVGEVLGAQNAVTYLFSYVNVEYGIFAGLVSVYAIVGIIYLLTSKSAKELFVN